MLRIIALLLGLCLCGSTVFANTSADQEAYIKRYKDIAMREMERSGVPASIKLAQGLLESGAGKSTLARQANNHFGIKCGRNWKGEEYYKEDDDYNSQGRLIKSCFRRYRNPEASFVAHSEFLRDPAKAFRYGFLFRLNPTDYKGWATGLRRAGYATNPRYPQLLISLVERYNLAQYDRPGAVDPVDVEGPVTEIISGIRSTNDVSYFVSEAPVSVDEVAEQVNVSVKRLVKYNEAIDNSKERVRNGERVYLQKKRRAYRGRQQYHTVKPGETLFDIAQQYALRLNILARRNRISESANPATGERIKLRGGKVKAAPKLEKDAPARPTNTRPNVTPTTNPSTTPAPRPGTVVAPRPTTPAPATSPRTNIPTTTPGATTSFHSVRAGETLYAISRKYGLSVAALKQLNGLTDNNISVGQQLRVR